MCDRGMLHRVNWQWHTGVRTEVTVTVHAAREGITLMIFFKKNPGPQCPPSCYLLRTGVPPDLDSELKDTVNPRTMEQMSTLSVSHFSPTFWEIGCVGDSQYVNVSVLAVGDDAYSKWLKTSEWNTFFWAQWKSAKTMSNYFIVLKRNVSTL